MSLPARLYVRGAVADLISFVLDYMAYGVCDCDDAGDGAHVQHAGCATQGAHDSFHLPVSVMKTWSCFASCYH